MTKRADWLGWAGAIVLLAWCVNAAIAGRASQARREPDPMAELDASYRRFAADLPPLAIVGFLERYNGATNDSVRMHYAAQYALVPRLVVSRTGPEFVIVSPEMQQPGGDPRLEGYYRVAGVPGGHQLFRRLAR